MRAARGLSGPLAVGAALIDLGGSALVVSGLGTLMASVAQRQMPTVAARNGCRYPSRSMCLICHRVALGLHWRFRNPTHSKTDIESLWTALWKTYAEPAGSSYTTSGCQRRPSLKTQRLALIKIPLGSSRPLSSHAHPFAAYRCINFNTRPPEVRKYVKIWIAPSATTLRFARGLGGNAG
jgi:hypothetical protein